jgi:hypothetical protein
MGLMFVGGLTVAMGVVFLLHAAISGDWNENVIAYGGGSIFAVPLFRWGLSLFRAGRR